MNGVLVMDKPAGFTSFDVVAVMRRLTGERKIGHTGTLDPMATGVLPLLLGRAAKAADLLPDTSKIYTAQFQLGEKRDTGDSTGKLIETDDSPVTRIQLEAALAPFRGNIQQTPPMYSAVSVGGKRLYELARKGIEVLRDKRPVTVTRLELDTYDPQARTGSLTVACSKGTYIRTLIEDIAAQAGTCGCMTALRRTEACGFSLNEAITLDAAKALPEPESFADLIRPVDMLFAVHPFVRVSPAQAVRFQNGGTLDSGRLQLPKAAAQGCRIRVYAPDGIFLGLGLLSAEKGGLRPLKLFAVGDGA